VIALIKFSLAASSAGIYSSSRPTSPSSSDSLISPASVFYLCLIPMSSILARRFRIPLSMSGFCTYLPLSLDNSLSSSGSGDCLPLLLGGMVNFPFSLLQKAKKIFLALIPLDADRATQARPLSQDLLLLGLNNSKVLLFPYREIHTHNNLPRSPLY
jgi:hypothetical protein